MDEFTMYATELKAIKKVGSKFYCTMHMYRYPEQAHHKHWEIQQWWPLGDWYQWDYTSIQVHALSHHPVYMNLSWHTTFDEHNASFHHEKKSSQAPQASQVYSSSSSSPSLASTSHQANSEFESTLTQARYSYLKQLQEHLLHTSLHDSFDLEHIQKALVYQQEIDWCLSDVQNRKQDMIAQILLQNQNDAQHLSDGSLKQSAPTLILDFEPSQHSISHVEITLSSDSIHHELQYHLLMHAQRYVLSLQLVIKEKIHCTHYTQFDFIIIDSKDHASPSLQPHTQEIHHTPHLQDMDRRLGWPTLWSLHPLESDPRHVDQTHTQLMNHNAVDPTLTQVETGTHPNQPIDLSVDEHLSTIHPNDFWKYVKDQMHNNAVSHQIANQHLHAIHLPLETPVMINQHQVHLQQHHINTYTYNVSQWDLINQKSVYLPPIHQRWYDIQSYSFPNQHPTLSAPFYIDPSHHPKVHQVTNTYNQIHIQLGINQSIHHTSHISYHILDQKNEPLLSSLQTYQTENTSHHLSSIINHIDIAHTEALSNQELMQLRSHLPPQTPILIHYRLVFTSHKASKLNLLIQQPHIPTFLCNSLNHPSNNIVSSSSDIDLAALSSVHENSTLSTEPYDLRLQCAWNAQGEAIKWFKSSTELIASVLPQFTSFTHLYLTFYPLAIGQSASIDFVYQIPYDQLCSLCTHQVPLASNHQG